MGKKTPILCEFIAGFLSVEKFSVLLTLWLLPFATFSQSSQKWERRTGWSSSCFARNSLGLPCVALPKAALSSFSCSTALGWESKGRVKVVILELLRQKMWGHRSSQHVETDPEWQQLHGGSCRNCPNLSLATTAPPCWSESTMWNKNILTALSNVLLRPRKWTGWATVSLTQTHPRERRRAGQTFTRLCLKLLVSTAPECKPLLHPNHTFQIYSYWNHLSGSLISSPPNLLVTSNTLQHAFLVPTGGEAHKLVLEILWG